MTSVGGDHKGALITAAGAVVAAIIAGIFALVVAGVGDGGTPPGGDPTPAPFVTTDAPPAPFIGITSPKAGATAPMSGVTVSGIARNLPKTVTLWLFDHDGSGYYRVNDTPIQVEPDDTWEFFDGPIGDRPDQRLTLVLVAADPLCDKALRAIKLNSDGSHWLEKLPASCPDKPAASVAIRTAAG